MNYCRHYGFDPDGRKRRLELFQLSHRDRALAVRLQRRVIRPFVLEIANTLYDYLGAQEEFNRVVAKRSDIARLKRTQTDYLYGLGLRFDSAGYFERRLRVGAAHARIGVPLSLYQAAYCQLQRRIIADIVQVFPAGTAEAGALIAFLLKIIALDMSLAVDTYHLTCVDDLERSIDALRDEASRWHQRADTDLFTGLANREHILALLHEMFMRAQHERRPLSVIMADLDRFKTVNDTYGHLVGDGVLRGVTARIRAAVRNQDIVGRYGGEEFLAVLQDAPMALAQEIAERVRRRVAETPIDVDGRAIPMTISLGVATMSPDEDVSTLIERADDALYCAKRAGRNQAVISTWHNAQEKRAS